MRFIIVILLAFSTLCCALGSASTHQATTEPKPNIVVTPSLEKQSRANDSKIVAGVRVGSVALGDTIDDVNNLLESESGGPISSTYEGCTSWFGTWFIGNPKKDYLHVEFDEPGIARGLRTYAVYLETTDGITYGDDSTAVKEKYNKPNGLEAFISLGMRSTNNRYIEGWPMYWVDQSTGIAFEFVRTKDEKKWILQSISVFDPLETFHGSYCDLGGKYWRRLSSLAPDHSEIHQIESGIH